MEAGRRWAQGGGRDEAAGDARHFGLDPAQLPATGEFRLWREHANAFSLFLAAASQWRSCFNGARVVFLGLDYAGAQAAWAALGLVATGDDFARLQAIEAGAAAALNGARP